MTNILKELKELDAKATKKPWSYIDEWSGIYDAPDMRWAQVRVAEIIRTPDYKSNAQLIAASRNALPELIRVIELAEEALLNLKTTIDGLSETSKYWTVESGAALSEIRKLKGE